MASPSDQDDAPFRPRIGGRRGEIKPQRVPTFRRSILARIEQRFVRFAKDGASTSQKGGGRTSVGADVREPRAYARRCLIKARIVQMKRGGTIAARVHLNYIERDGVERDGSKGELYLGATVSREALRDSVRGERHQFRFIVSPEDSGVDLTAFTRALMGQVERDLGRQLVWAAVNHHDTDNPHVHIVVRGVDTRGREVRIDREYISRRMRWRAQEIVTRELGPRAPAELDRQRDKEVGQERLTGLDREIERLLSGAGGIDMADLAKVSRPRQRARLLGRVQVLERLALARPQGPGRWVLEDGWQGSLRTLGERGDVIKRIHAALPRRGESARFHVIDGAAEQRPVEGVLRRKGLHDELRGDMYAIVEDAQGHAHYLRADAATLAPVDEGAIVRVSAARDTWAKGMDAAIVRFGALSDGVYDPVAHARELQRTPLVIGGQRVEPKAVIDANVRRLERLSRYRLAERLADGRWRVPADLVAQLKAREKTHPRLRVKVERIAPPIAVQMETTGPAWVDTATASAPYGFGAEVHAARRARRERAPALEGETGERLRAELRAVGERLARERGLRFVASPPSGYHGRLLEFEPAGASRYVGVVDDRARALALVPRSLVPHGGLGRTVELVRRADGSVVLRQRELGRGA